MNDLEYRLCRDCGNSVMDGMGHACREDARLVRTTIMNVSGLLFFIFCLVVGLFAAIPVRAQAVEQGVYRASTPSQVLAVDTTARTATASIFANGVAMLTCTAACFFNIAKTPLVTTSTGSFLPANVPTLWSVHLNDRIQVVLSTSTGTIVIQELTK
jgi:hypothetical protein